MVVPPMAASNRQSKGVAGSVNSSESQVPRHSRSSPIGPLGDHAPHQRHRGQPPVVEAHRVGHSGGRDGGQCRRRAGVGDGEWLLAQHRLARRGGGRRDLRVRAGWRADVHDGDVVAGDDVAPVGGVLGHPVGHRGGRHGRLVPAGDHADHGRDRQPAQHRRDPVGVAVRLAHHPVADDPDAQFGWPAHAPSAGMAAPARVAASSAATASAPGGARGRGRRRRSRRSSPPAAAARQAAPAPPPRGQGSRSAPCLWCRTPRPAPCPPPGGTGPARPGRCRRRTVPRALGRCPRPRTCVAPPPAGAGPARRAPLRTRWRPCCRGPARSASASRRTRARPCR